MMKMKKQLWGTLILTLALCLLPMGFAVAAPVQDPVITDLSTLGYQLFLNTRQSGVKVYGDLNNQSSATEYTGTLTIKQAPNTTYTNSICVYGTHTVVLDGVHIETNGTPGEGELGVSAIELRNASSLNANLTLHLADNSVNTLTTQSKNAAAILVPEGATLTLTGATGANAANAGKLTAVGGDRGSCIGSAGGNSGDIIIDGGKIVANGSRYCTGIGGGYGGDGHVTIYDGEITATAGDYGTGIGGGYNGDGYVTINGGRITARGGQGSAGIGAGVYGVAAVTINGGTIVEAIGGAYAAGIGGGEGRSTSAAGNATVTITDGTIVKAMGGHNGAGIGGGNSGNADVSISGGTMMEAIGGRTASGIGGGYCGDGNVTITGGAIAKAQGGAIHIAAGAGIGGGGSWDGVGGVGNVTITGSAGMHILAVSEYRAIGDGKNATATSGKVAISGMRIDNSLTTNSETYIQQSRTEMWANGETISDGLDVNQTLTGSGDGSITGGASLIGANDADSVELRRLTAQQARDCQPMIAEIGGTVLASMNVSIPAGSTLKAVTFSLDEDYARQKLGGDVSSLVIGHLRANGELVSHPVKFTQDSGRLIVATTGEIGSASPFVLLGRGVKSQPKTGDNATPWLWLALCALGACGAALAIRRKRSA